MTVSIGKPNSYPIIPFISKGCMDYSLNIGKRNGSRAALINLSSVFISPQICYNGRGKNTEEI